MHHTLADALTAAGLGLGTNVTGMLTPQSQSALPQRRGQRKRQHRRRASKRTRQGSCEKGGQSNEAAGKGSARPHRSITQEWRFCVTSIQAAARTIRRSATANARKEARAGCRTTRSRVARSAHANADSSAHRKNNGLLQSIT